MDPENNGDMRLTREQVNKLAQAVNRGSGVEEISLSRGSDGRLIVKEVVKVERMKALKLY